MDTTEKPSVPTGKKSAFHLSKDGKWRSFSRVPHLLQYVSSGIYFARIKSRGKIIRQSLERTLPGNSYFWRAGTDVWSDAQLKLVDFLKEKQTVRETIQEHKVPFNRAIDLYKKQVENAHSMKKRSKSYRFLCIRKIESSWPGVTSRILGELTETECREWAIKLKGEIPTYT